MSKRRNGSGTVFQRKSDGAWLAQVTYRSDDGKRHTISRSAKSQAAAHDLLATLPTNVPTPAERFLGLLPDRPETGCWEWLGARANGGYGLFAVQNPRRITAHRYSWELHNGPIPAGMHVLHHCDNPPCVNPAHLFLGTASDNMRDMLAKGRGRNQSPI